MSITEISIKRPTLIVVIFAVLAILGITCYNLLNYELVPKLSFPAISVSTVYPGASANVVENSVTKKIEDALSSLENVNSIQSTSQEGISIISIELDANADADKSVQDAQRKVNAILSTLPDGISSPSINKFSSDETPVMKIGLTSNLENTELYQIVKEEIKPLFSKIEGVAQVSIIGGNEREIKIEIDKEKIKTYNLTATQVLAAVNSANIEIPTGNVETGLTQYSIRLKGKFQNILEIKNVNIPTLSGTYIKLSEIADVTDGVKEPTTINKINGIVSLGITIQKQTDANTVKVCELIKEQITVIEKQYETQQIKFNIASDNSTYTLDSVNAVMFDLMFAVLLVSFVMFIFLHSFRNSFIILISIPASIISVFIAMYIFGFTLNLLTLMALSLVVGILVDDSIVVLENIYRHLEMKKDRRTAALEGRTEIGFTALAITLVDVVVFLPLSLVSGMIGNMLREFSLVIVFSTLMSLLVSFTVTPLLASRFSKIQEYSKKTIMGRFSVWVENIYNKLSDSYEKILRWSLGHRKLVYFFITVLILFSFSLFGMGLIGTAFMQEADKGEFIIKIEGEPQNNIYQTEIITKQIEDMLLKKPDVVKVFSNIGSSGSEFGGSTSEKNKSEITVNLVSKEERELSVSEYSAMIKKEIQEIPGIKVTSTPTSMMGSADDAPIQVLLQGSDINRLYEVGDSIIKILKNVPGTNDIKYSVDKSNPELHISLDREKMELLGLNVQQVASTLNLSYVGNTDVQFTENENDYDVNIQYSEFDRDKIDDILSVTFQNSKGKFVELSSFATVTQSLGPNKLERYDRVTSLIVKCSVFNRPIGIVGQEIKAQISENIKVSDVTIDYKGQMEMQSDAFKSLFTALIAAIVFVYLIMVALYNSYLHPFIVLFSIPVAIIGALMALALSGEYLSIFSIIGLIMLIGLVTKNAILIVDFANKAREEGLSVYDALIKAGKERLRPILMMTLSMIFGMLPIALASGASAESKNGMAWVIIGGLTSSLLLTLILVPSVYMSMEKYKEKIIKRFSKKQVVEV
jgi:HAE1 family hydrophobic/amphiphilic exporter-1